jgi:hypothetical protein
MGSPATPSLPLTAPRVGYTPAHAMYEEDRKQAQAQAFVMHCGMVGIELRGGWFTWHQEQSKLRFSG